MRAFLAALSAGSSGHHHISIRLARLRPAARSALGHLGSPGAGGTQIGDRTMQLSIPSRYPRDAAEFGADHLYIANGSVV